MQEDPAEGMARDIAEYSGMMRRFVGWGPEGLDQRFLRVVAGMRADRMRALLYACALVTLPVLAQTFRVDDSGSQVLGGPLRLSGFEVSTAVDGAEAIRWMMDRKAMGKVLIEA